MGPKSLYLGEEVPQETLIWQDPIPATSGPIINETDIKALKQQLSNSGITNAEMVQTAWASASTFRGSDKRGGANGARIALAPQKDWAVNQPETLAKVLDKYREIKNAFNAAHATQVSLADLIVLGGSVGIEQAAAAAGHKIVVPFTPGRTDASQEETDVLSFAVLEPQADGFRNYVKTRFSVSDEELLLDKAQLLTLSPVEMTVLVGGMRMLDTNYDGSTHGVFTKNKGALSNDFFVQLLDLSTKWEAANEEEDLFMGRDRKTGALKWSASRVDLIFGSNSELRALAEVYACDDSQDKFLCDFVAAWTKVMELDRFDLK
jgi:catalase-peroxidase